LDGSRLALAASFIPSVALMAVGYLAPIALSVTMSLYDDAGSFVGFDNYLSVFNSYYFLDSLAFTLKISISATALSMAVAVVVALAIRQTFLGKKLVVLMFQFNLTVPRMAAAMMLLLLLSQTGLLSQAAHQLGLIQTGSQFPWFVRDSEGLGVIMAFAWKFFPYIGMSVLGVLQGACTDYEDQAAVLGVGRVRRFLHVTLPMIVPATSIASIIVFAAAFGDYEMPAILGNSSHRVLSVFTYMKYSSPDMMNRPESYALMIIMSLLLMAVILAYRRLTMPPEKGRHD
jgi:putative spermidine/putrescine transport system permease protein